MLILIIGPSGVGKSTLGDYASKKFSNCEFYDLDNLIKKRYNSKSTKLLFSSIGPDLFFESSCKALTEIENKYDSQICLTAVGAGTLVSQKSKDLIVKYTTISITAPQEEVFLRNPLGLDRGIEEFKSTEYSKHRLSLYKSTNFNFKADGLNKEQSENEFLKFLQDNVISILRT